MWPSLLTSMSYNVPHYEGADKSYRLQALERVCEHYGSQRGAAVNLRQKDGMLLDACTITKWFVHILICSIWNCKISSFVFVCNLMSALFGALFSRKTFSHLVMVCTVCVCMRGTDDSYTGHLIRWWDSVMIWFGIHVVVMQSLHSFLFFLISLLLM